MSVAGLANFIAVLSRKISELTARESRASALIVFVMTGIVPAVYVLVQGTLFPYLNYKVEPGVAQLLVVSPRRPSGATWMAVTSMAMTEDGSFYQHRRPRTL